MRVLVAAMVLTSGCGGSAQLAAPVSTVEVPDARPARAEPGEGREREVLPPRAAEEPPPPSDPFDGFVGDWDGLVNQTVSTLLVIDRSGRFKVSATPTPQRTACELEGRFRAAADQIWMDVDKTSCTVIAVGSTLERRIVSQTDDEFTVESPDGTLLIRYTRRAP